MDIFDSRNTIAITFVMGSVIVLLLGFGSLGLGVANDNLQQQRSEKLQEQKEFWRNNSPSSYQYTIRAGCMMTFQSTGFVKDGVTSFIENDEKLEIDYLFWVARKALTSASDVEIKYHPTYGVPSYIKVDWSIEVIDDECGYSLLDFKEV